MIAHVAAVSLLSECKVLSHPSSVDNLPTSGGKEDHVSMGMTAALKFRSIVANMENLIAVELLCAAQGIEFRRPLRAGEGVEQAHAIIRELVPKLEEDRALAGDIAAVASAIRDGGFAGVT
jgi:histidine ammonia-lyase